MKLKNELQTILNRIDGKGYKAYKDLKGAYSFDNYTLIIDHVQGDPFAAPSKIRVQVAQGTAGFPEDTWKNKSREIALRDFLTRRFSEACRRFAKGNRGTGKSGAIAIDRPGQEILERTSVLVDDSGVEARFIMGLPAFGRKVAGRHCAEMIFKELPQIVDASLIFNNLNREELYRHIETSEDADFLRDSLEGKGLIAFVADGAILPRASGIDPRPLKRGNIVPFESPESLRVEIGLPNRGVVSGMGIREGITLIVGGGYHGKSTLLEALELGIYNHIPGDGREFVVADPRVVKIRAEEGRRIEKTCITPFISNLPFGQETDSFSTEDASGSTSQSANIIEALEAGADTLLIDEDTSATNFMIRDHRMQELVSKEREPITPFIDKVRNLYKDRGVSTILVIGGSGDYFDVADCVVCMIEYKPFDVTNEARRISEKYRAERAVEGGESFGAVIGRVPVAGSFDPSRGKRDVKIGSRGLKEISFGAHNIDLGAIEQLVDTSQPSTIGDAIHYARRYMDGERTLKEVIDLVMKDISEKGLDALNTRPVGDYAEFRGIELACAMNRLRTLEVVQKK